MANNVPAACLRRLGATQEYRYIPLQAEKVIIGRAKEVTYNIADILISRIHAIFRFSVNQWTVESVGMNGILLNQEVIPQNKPVAISDMDVIELSVGSKFIYTFREQAREVCEPSAKKMKMNLQNCIKGPSVKDVKAFKNWVQSKKKLEQALMEESETLEYKLLQHSSLEEHLVNEKARAVSQANDLVLELKSRFHAEKKALEESVTRGEMENNELQKLVDILEQKMARNMQEIMVKCSRKTLELEEELAKSNEEKQFLIEQKEVIVQQLQRENSILEERLNEEKRVSAAAIDELSKLRECRENLEKKLQDERKKFEEERNILLQQGNEAVSRLRQLENENRKRDFHYSDAVESQSGEKETCAPEPCKAGLPIIPAEHRKVDTTWQTNSTAAKSLFSSESSPAEKELERVRRELQDSLAEKEKMQQQLETAAAKARMDALGKLENVVENELQCSICSELFVMATSLGCGHVFCCYCIESWKKNRDECPICRAPINSMSRSLIIDNAIDGIVASLSEEVQIRREKLIQQRRQLAISSTEHAERPSTSGQKGRNRGNRRGGRGRNHSNSRQ